MRSTVILLITLVISACGSRGPGPRGDVGSSKQGGGESFAFPYLNQALLSGGVYDGQGKLLAGRDVKIHALAISSVAFVVNMGRATIAYLTGGAMIASAFVRPRPPVAIDLDLEQFGLIPAEAKRFLAAPAAKQAQFCLTNPRLAKFCATLSEIDFKIAERAGAAI